MLVYIMALGIFPNTQNTNIVCLVSPSFCIKAKKPILKPGIQKRKLEEVEEDLEEEESNTTKKQEDEKKKPKIESKENQESKKENLKSFDANQILNLIENLDETSKFSILEKLIIKSKDLEKEILFKKYFSNYVSQNQINNDINSEMDSFFLNLVNDEI
jgi:hypothetical protein